jgi:cytochrome c-type biogenesis protein CcmH
MLWRGGFLHSLLLAMVVLLGLAGSGARAVEPDEILSDPRLEARARALSVDLRCLVCQNQSIDDSNAPLARDLRLLVRERLKAGDSDADVMRFIVSRYGDFVLLRPPLNWKTLVLWLSAPLLLLLVGWMLWRAVPAASTADARAPSAPLTGEEELRLEKLLARDDGDGAEPTARR